MQLNRFLTSLVVLVICFCSCSTESKRSEYFVVELPPKYEGYLNIVFMNDTGIEEQLTKKGVFLSVKADSSGTVLVRDEYKDWMAKLRLSFIDSETKRNAAIFNSGSDSSRVFGINIIDIGYTSLHKCVRAFVTKDLIPNSDTSSLLLKRASKAYQLQKLSVAMK